MGSNPSWFSSSGYGSSKVSGMDTSNFPVENVSWTDCQDFIEKLNTGGYAPSGFQFRLPSEAQWEYACRATTTGPYFWGSSLNGDKANCKGDAGYGNYAPNEKGVYLDRSCEVRSYEPNPWGLYDMHGNAAEWCLDSYAVPSGNRADVSDKADPARPIDKKTRIVRGGSWGDAADDCRSAANLEYRHPAMRLKPAATDGFRFILYPTK
jgi:formylglycine-generating enzyme required for sulfatase activity